MFTNIGFSDTYSVMEFIFLITHTLYIMTKIFNYAI